MIRVLRVLEYTYADAETAIADQKIWTEKIGPGESPKRMTMDSRTFPMTVEPDPAIAALALIALGKGWL